MLSECLVIQPLRQQITCRFSSRDGLALNVTFVFFYLSLSLAGDKTVKASSALFLIAILAAC